jgi:CheY-like chemotaxis protein
MIPLAGSDGEVAPANTAPTGAPWPSQFDSAISGLCVLVLDDDQDARDLLTDVLETHGMRVIAVPSIIEALLEFDRLVPDIVVSDLRMPDQDRCEFVRRIRERPPERGGMVPAIALTAYAASEDRARALTAGFQVHLQAGRLPRAACDVREPYGPAGAKAAWVRYPGAGSLRIVIRTS